MRTESGDSMLDALLARLAERVGDLAPHINRERVATDLKLVRWAAQREDHIGVTPADRREVAGAVQRLNEIVFDGPDSPDPATFPQDRLSLERSTAELAEAAGHWLEGTVVPKGYPMTLSIHTAEGTQELDLTEVRTIEIKDDATPLFELRHRPDRTAIEVRVLRASARLAIRSLGSTGVELRPDEL